jgi:two-component system chemotaxis response regulator CheY
MSTKRTCLVVDDSTTIRRVVAGLFRDLNFAVSEAPTGLHAVEHCEKETPDVVMLDWNMPVMDGITCLRALRTMDAPKRPIVVMCTTESQIAKIQEALESGADEYIMKPFNRDVLFDKLSQLGLV